MINRDLLVAYIFRVTNSYAHIFRVTHDDNPMDLGLHYFQTNPYAQFMARQNPSLLWPLLKKPQCDQGPTLVTKVQHL